jgi:hypothetical protein
VARADLKRDESAAPTTRRNSDRLQPPFAKRWPVERVAGSRSVIRDKTTGAGSTLMRRETFHVAA